jgi:para-nitrobenzyl esterase
VQEHAEATESQTDLSEQMIDFWAEFAKTGQPGGEWQEYADGESFVMELNTLGASGTDASDFGANHRCAYWADPFSSKD